MSLLELYYRSSDVKLLLEEVEGTEQYKVEAVYSKAVDKDIGVLYLVK